MFATDEYNGIMLGFRVQGAEAQGVLRIVTSKSARQNGHLEIWDHLACLRNWAPFRSSTRSPFYGCLKLQLTGPHIAFRTYLFGAVHIAKHSG